MEQGFVRRFGFWTAVVFVLLLAFAGAIWGAEYVLRQMGLSLQSWAEAIFILLVVAMAFGFYLVRKAAFEFGPPIRLYIHRPADLAAKDDITARWRTINLPYAINDGMVLTLNEPGVRDPEIQADVVAVDRLICSENDGWVIATLELHDAKDFERLGAAADWYEVRGNIESSPKTPPRPVGQSTKTLQ